MENHSQCHRNKFLSPVLWYTKYLFLQKGMQVVGTMSSLKSHFLKLSYWQYVCVHMFQLLCFHNVFIFFLCNGLCSNFDKIAHNTLLLYSCRQRNHWTVRTPTDHNSLSGDVTLVQIIFVSCSLCQVIGSQESRGSLVSLVSCDARSLQGGLSLFCWFQDTNWIQGRKLNNFCCGGGAFSLGTYWTNWVQIWK